MRKYGRVSRVRHRSQEHVRVLGAPRAATPLLFSSLLTHIAFVPRAGQLHVQHNKRNHSPLGFHMYASRLALHEPAFQRLPSHNIF